MDSETVYDRICGKPELVYFLFEPPREPGASRCPWITMQTIVIWKH